MKKSYLFSLILLMITAIAVQSKEIGTIDTLNSREVIVRITGKHTPSMGDSLEVQTENEKIILEVIFPMLTVAKCKLKDKNKNYLLKKGMNVYRFGESQAKSPETSKLTESEIFSSIEMVKLSGGTFIMGSPISEKDRSDDEKQHEVTISPFSISKYEITQKQYVDIMGTNPSKFKGENLPVENISWYKAIEFCNRLSEKNSLKPYYSIKTVPKDTNNSSSSLSKQNYKIIILGGNGFRLPTEAEWEYSCRCNTNTPFFYGNFLDTNTANFNAKNLPSSMKTKETADDRINRALSQYDSDANSGVYREKTLEIGSFKPNSFGIYDMHGNVSEWCFDYYGPYHDNAKDPSGPENNNFFIHINRGGSWFSSIKSLRSSARGNNYATDEYSYIGFRIARTH